MHSYTTACSLPIRYYDELVVPIIDNTPEESDLTVSAPCSHLFHRLALSLTHTPQEWLEEALVNYPDCCAVLVRRHGVYVWGESWQKAKTM